MKWFLIFFAVFASAQLPLQRLPLPIVSSKLQPATFYGVTNQPVFWLKADAQTLNNGDPVTSPVDSSGRGTGATFGQASSGLKPTFKTGGLNGLPSFYFDGGDCLTNPSVAISTFTLFIVASNSAAGLLYEHGPAANLGQDGGYMVPTDGCSIGAVRGTVNASFKEGVPSYGIGTWIVFRQDFDGTHAGNLLSTNGVATSATICSSLNSDPGTGTVTLQMNLGARNNGTGGFVNGHVPEYILFSPALTGADLTTVATNIQRKYFP